MKEIFQFNAVLLVAIAILALIFVSSRNFSGGRKAFTVGFSIWCALVLSALAWAVYAIIHFISKLW